MKKKDKVLTALLAVFPTNEAFSQFTKNNDNTPALQSFIVYALRNRLIENSDPKSLEALITRNARSSEDCRPPDHLNFEELLEKKKDLLKFGLSVRSLTDNINNLLEQNGIKLPPVSNPMLTRLKTQPADTPYKQNALRSFAFWLGHERADLGPTWNYETLLKLCPQNKPTEQYKEGVRIGFALYSRGDVIDHSVMNWLKKAIHNYMGEAMGESLHGQWSKVRSHDFTTLFVDIPKKERSSDPASFRSCLKHALSLTHQVSIRWALSRFCTSNRFLSIGIVAGEYAALDNYLFPLLNAKISGDPIIRVSDYVRQCMLINDIRAILCHQPSEATLFNGEALRIWWIMTFWSMLYFDFVPDLLKDRMLMNNPSYEETLPQLLWFPEHRDIKSTENDEPSAISSFFRFPHNAFLGIEIAKTLYYRRRFQEAIEILRIVLSIDPILPTARTLRMALFRELALNSPAYSVANNFFKQAVNEALYIIEECESKSEDFYCEYATIFITKAIMSLRYLRKQSKELENISELTRIKQTIFDSLDQSELLLEKAMTASSFAIRSSYALNVTRVLQAILKHDEDIFVNPEKPVDGPPQVVARPSSDFLWQLRLMKEELPRYDQHDFMEKIFIKRFRIHDESISLRSFRPNTHFCHAVALWDFAPVRTVAIAKRVLNTLQYARKMAEVAAMDDVCIYSSTRVCVEIMPADNFIRHMDRSIQMVHAVAGQDIMSRDDSETLKLPSDLSSSLMTLNF